MNLALPKMEKVKMRGIKLVLQKLILCLAISLVSFMMPADAGWDE
ncbi:MAG: hypothetical protein Q8N08_04405 [Methanobacteriaceae archaeon]|nr:hypothetical protein [Methanobacteriaceae archaeon]